MHTPHHYLPPSLQPLPNKPSLPTLLITIVDIAYLQILPANRPTAIRYKWWGLKNELLDHPLSSPTHQFFITVSEQMFLRYCMDMKVLEFQLYDRVGKGVAKGYLNFSLLKGWQGQEYETVCELKSCKNTTKVGEIKMKISLSEQKNPAYSNANSNHNLIDPYSLTQQKFRKMGNQVNPMQTKNNRPQVDHVDHVDHEFAYNQHLKPVQQPRINHDSLDLRPNKAKFPSNLSNLHSEMPPNQQNVEEFQLKLRKKIGFPLPTECICESIRPNQFTLEKLRLKQEIQMFFNTVTEYSSEQLNLQALGWRPENKNDDNMVCKLTVPVLDKGSNLYSNEYSLGKGTGLIKVLLNTSTHSQEEIKNYLINNQIQIKVGSYQGAVPLFQVAGSRGDLIRVQIYDKKNKKQVLKGHFLIKLVSSPQKPLKNSQNKQQPRQGEEKQNIQKNEKIYHEESSNYIWLFVGQLHFLQPSHWQSSNIFGIVRWREGEIKTKTIWGSQSPIFNQIVTIKMPVDVVIEFWNRKSSQRLAGKAHVKPKQIKQNRVEIPVQDQHGRVQGYINLCIGKGDLMAATQFLNTHVRVFNQPQSARPEPAHPSYQEPNESKQQEQNLEQPAHQEREQISSVHSHDQSVPSADPSPRNRDIEEQEEMEILEIHNKLFTSYLAKDCDWLTTYRDRYTSLGEFLELAKPIYKGTGNRSLVKLASFYFKTKENSVKLDQIQFSLQSFKVYYDILSNERDEIMVRTLQLLDQVGITINQLEMKFTQAPQKARAQSSFVWKYLKEQLDPNIAERLRYFYQKLSIEQLCDCFRRFEVYETTKGQQIEIEILKRQVYTEITEVLGIDPHSESLKESIEKAGLELSKFELLCLFGELPEGKQQNKMVKSPTFGYLATDRIPKPIPLKDNSSLAFNLEKQELRNLSLRFGNPNISPINQHTEKNRKIRVGFKDLVEVVLQICINGKEIEVGRAIDNQFIEVSMSKAFSFEGYVKTVKNGILEFEGPIGEWIALVDEVGRYCGCVIFQ